MQGKLFYFAPVVLFAGIAFASQPTLITLGKPTYPPLAHQANVSGDVVVNVTINEDGSVKSAVVASGHPLLKGVAIDSALHSKFDCSSCGDSGQYRLVYTFKLDASENCCDASRDITVTQEPEAQTAGIAETHVTLSGERTCICDPAFTITRRARSLKCLYLWKCTTTTR
jgi:TonB family protein